jgi:hypothetical protein
MVQSAEDRQRQQAVLQLLSDSGIENADVTSEDGQQSLQSPEDWWTVVLGSGYRWTVEQMSDEETARVKAPSDMFRGSVYQVPAVS